MTKQERASREERIAAHSSQRGETKGQWFLARGSRRFGVVNEIPSSVILAYRLEPGATPFGTGLINDTFRARRGEDTLVVQRVHPIFDASVHLDIEAVTTHLEKKGMPTPRLVRTVDDALFVHDEEGRVWRALTFLEGAAHDRFPSRAHVREAGALVGRFHDALRDLEHTYVFARRGVHDLGFRRAALDEALTAHRGHRLFDEVSRLTERVAELTTHAMPIGAHPPRHAHGDLKASNLLFRGHQGFALVDLDTMASMMWIFEMGDALRSWCNRGAEDDASSALDLDVYEAALTGYGATGLRVTEAERSSLARGVLTISLELAVRFLTDALVESYFGFDRTRYPARGEHNLARARAQTALATSVAKNLGALDDIAARTLVVG